jgi:alpha-beta hydrolase superfamily lysophospholipase
MVSGSMIDRRTVLAWLAAAVPTASLANDKPVAPKVVRSEVPHRSAAQIVYGSVKIGEVDVAYREAGPQDAPVILLLHGFPTSSHLFRTLIPLLADRYHLIAPDLPGFGNTVAPSRASFGYSFDHLADVMTGFIDGKANDLS